MKQISIFHGKPKRLEALFSDGYLTVIIWTGEAYRLEGKVMTFKTLAELAAHYKGEIKTIKEIKK
jgi:hypothetical protein